MSFRNTVLRTVRRLLRDAGFPNSRALPRTIVDLVDAMHSYTEEGRRLYPEVLITTSITDIVQALPSPRLVEIDHELNVAEGLPRALKRCAPLSSVGWTIFIQAHRGRVRYGLVTVENSDLSLSLYNHAVGELALPEHTTPVIYLRGTGAQRVEIKTKGEREVVTVSLREITSDEREISRLAETATADVPEGVRDRAKTYFGKLLGNSVRQTHGCLVAVVGDDSQSIAQLRERFPDGAYLRRPIDFVELISQAETSMTADASMDIRNHTAIVAGMLSHDGITVLTSKGRILGYNIFVPRDPAAPPASGGARSRAFVTLQSSGTVLACYSLSHDGASKLWRGE